MKLEQAIVLENERLGELEGRLWVHAPELAKTAHPGQFAMLECAENYDPFLRKAISINRIAGEAVAFAYQEVGKGTKALGKLNSGDKISYLGPLGKGFDLSPRGKKVLLIGGGIGRAPMEWLAEALAKRDNEVVVIFGAKNADGLGGVPLEKDWGKITWRFATEDGSRGVQGFVTQLMTDLEDYDQVYACGPTPMMQAVKEICQKAEKPLQISLEGKMACGVGVCLGCTCKGKHEDEPYPKVCKNGPVFWSEEVELKW